MQKAHFLRIAVSRLSPNYAGWLNKLVRDLQITDLNLYEPGELNRGLKSHSGLILTGGGDIHPGLYGRRGMAGMCTNVDEKRDELELKMIEVAVGMGIPILAVCRGMQLMNVFRGGTLYADIPSFIGREVVHHDHLDVFHPVAVHSDSWLFRISRQTGIVVNSSHHQAVEKLAEGMTVTATATDGVVEAIEYNKPGQSFCVGVQWHPERMDIENPLSGELGRKFMEVCVG